MSLKKQRSAEAENKVPIPFKLVIAYKATLGMPSRVREKQAAGKRQKLLRNTFILLAIPSFYPRSCVCWERKGGKATKVKLN